MIQHSFDTALGLLTRSMHLLSWWRPTGQAGEGSPLERMRTVLRDANAAMLDAGEKQARAVAALNEELPALILEAARARDPQTLLEAELAIASRIRKCAAECCEVWSGAAAWGKAGAQEPAEKRIEPRSP
jgi:hypothetical protein